MASRLAIEARLLGKAFPLDQGIRELLGLRRLDGRLWAVRDICVELPRGCGLAVIGRNGAGKSTLLRLLLGLAGPTSGWVRVHGRMAGLLELGAGLVAEWTGEENARAAFSLVGQGAPSLATVREFSGLGRALERPVRGYSSGMRLRLAYAVAVATQPDVLIADEVIGVGDEDFLRRCARYVDDFLRSGGTLVLATHNLYLAEKLCQRALWLDRGVAVAEGPCGLVTRLYRERAGAERGCSRAPRSTATEIGLRANLPDRAEALGAEIALAPGEPLEVRSDALSGSGLLELEVEDGGGRLVSTRLVPARSCYALSAGALLPGRYRVRLTRRDGGGRSVIAERWVLCRGERRDLGPVLLAHEWGGTGHSRGCMG